MFPKWWRAGWAAPSSSWAETTASSVMDDANPDLVAARRPVRRRGHRRPALHHHAAPVPPARHRARITEALIAAYRQVKIGERSSPRNAHGSPVNRRAVDDMMDGVRRIREQGGESCPAAERLTEMLRPAHAVRAAAGDARLEEEIFAPDSLPDPSSTISTRPSTGTTTCRRDSPRRCSRPT